MFFYRSCRMPQRVIAKTLLPFCSICGLLLFLAAPIASQEFRALRPIVTPAAPPALPPGAKRVEGTFLPLDRHELEEAIGDIVAKWNTPDFGATLMDTFYDKTRLEDALNTDVPRDAKLRVLSLQGVQTLDQYFFPDPSGLPFDTLVSTISATVNLQVEFNDPSQGFQRRQGVNELVLRIVQRKLQ